MGKAQIWDGKSPKPKIEFIDMHLHSEYSLKDGKIRIMDHDDPDKVKKDIILLGERRNVGALTITDHGNMYAHAALAYVCKSFGFKHIPASEFYIAIGHRTEKESKKGDSVYRHICAWGKNKEGYANLCRLQELSYTEGFYKVPRIDKELIDKYGDNIMWSDACIGGTLSSLILEDKHDEAYNEFMWYLNRFKDDFYIEYQNHGIEEEEKANLIKIDWANKHGVPIIATTDAHYAEKSDSENHKILLSIQYQKLFDDPTFDGFPGDYYWLLNDDELLSLYPVEYLNNTKLLADKVEDNIIKFGDVTPPAFVVPEWFKG